LTGCFSFGLAFLTGARFGLALAIGRFAAFAFDTLRGLPRLAELPLRGLARVRTFGAFLRFAMIDPPVWLCSDTASKTTARVPATEQTSYHQISAFSDSFAV
jgi:hypothetical protein